jgi:guanylate kinase
MSIDRRGILLVISSPSGAGKTTLTRRLAAAHNLCFSVSYTTRQPRSGEIDGTDYHFVSHDVFDRMVAAGDFAEHALVHGNRYGTAIKTVNQAIERGPPTASWCSSCPPPWPSWSGACAGAPPTPPK